MHPIMLAAGLAAALVAPTAASAVSLVWTLQNAQFTDGGTLTGQFAFDADTLTFGDFAFATTGGAAVFPDFAYTPTNTAATAGSADQLRFESDTIFNGNPFQSRELRLSFVGPLTGSGGTVALTTDSVECFDCAPFRTLVAGGSVVAEAEVPAPAALGLLGSAVLALAARRRIARA